MLESATYILTTHTVEDLDDFVARPDHYLVSVEDDGARAAEVWRERTARNPYGGDGLVQLRYGGVDLIARDAWDDVDGIWMLLVEVARAVQERAEFDDSFPGTSLEVSVRPKRGGSTVAIGEARTFVEPQHFVAPLLADARRFFEWVQTEVGQGKGEQLDTIDAILAAKR